MAIKLNLPIYFALIAAISLNIHEVDALQCYTCLPSPMKGVQFPDCITNPDNHGTLTQCPGNSDVCLKTEVVVNGVAIHERECGVFDINQHSAGSRPDHDHGQGHGGGEGHGMVMSKNICKELAEGRSEEEDMVKVCTCDTDGCNSATQFAALSFTTTAIIPIVAYWLSK